MTHEQTPVERTPAQAAQPLTHKALTQEEALSAIGSDKMKAVHELLSRLLDCDRVNAALVMVILDDSQPLISLDVNSASMPQRAARILGLAKQCGFCVATLIDLAAATGRPRPA